MMGQEGRRPDADARTRGAVAGDATRTSASARNVAHRLRGRACPGPDCAALLGAPAALAWAAGQCAAGRHGAGVCHRRTVADVGRWVSHRQHDLLVCKRQGAAPGLARCGDDGRHTAGKQPCRVHPGASLLAQRAAPAGLRVALGTLSLWLVVELIKVLAHRRRPYVRLPEARIVGRRAGGRSFPSGHTSQSFFVATLLTEALQLDLWVAADCTLSLCLWGSPASMSGHTTPATYWRGQFWGAPGNSDWACLWARNR